MPSTSTPTGTSATLSRYPRRWSPYTLRRNNYESKQAPTNIDAKKQRNNLYTAVTNNTSTIHTGA